MMIIPTNYSSIGINHAFTEFLVHIKKFIIHRIIHCDIYKIFDSTVMFSISHQFYISPPLLVNWCCKITEFKSADSLLLGEEIVLSENCCEGMQTMITDHHQHYLIATINSPCYIYNLFFYWFFLQITTFSHL